MKKHNIEIFLLIRNGFYKNISDLAEKIMKLSRDDKLRKKLLEMEKGNI